jgi:hypothetical protein
MAIITDNLDRILASDGNNRGEAFLGETLPSIDPLCNKRSACIPITTMMMRQSSNIPLRIFQFIKSLNNLITRDDHSR